MIPVCRDKIVSFCRDPGSVLNCSCESFIQALRDPSFVLPGSWHEVFLQNPFSSPKLDEKVIQRMLIKQN